MPYSHLLEKLSKANATFFFERKGWAPFEYARVDAQFATVLGMSALPALELNQLADSAFNHSQNLQLEDQLLQAKEQNKPYSVVLKLADANGADIYIKEVGSYSLNAESKEPQFTGFLEDVTNVTTEDTFQATNKFFYQSTLNTLPIELVVLDAERRYIFCNEKAISDPELRAWLIGKTDFDYCTFRGKDAAIVAERNHYYDMAVAESREVEWEEVQVLKDGSHTFNVRRYSPIADQNGKVQIVMGYGFDITDRRVAEEKVRMNEQLLTSINENVGESIYRFNAGGVLLYANSKFLDLFTVSSIEDFNASVFEEQKNLIVQLCGAEAMEAEGTEVLQTEIALRLGQDTVQGLINVKRNRSDADEVFYDGVMVDITKLKDYERSLISKNVELEKAYMELDRFVYSASHDLRAPLTSILGIVKVAELERKQIGNEAEVDVYLGMIKKSVDKLDSFVQDIIHYYRNSRVDNTSQTFDLAELLSTSFENLRYIKSASHIQFQLEEGAPQHLHHDRGRIQVIVNNLISNAIKYHKDVEGSKITAKALVDDENLTIWIADNGQGIKAEAQAHIFDMFYRAGADSVGSGLGLYIVSESVKKLGGKISVDSTLGKGSVFCVVLPLVLKSDE